MNNTIILFLDCSAMFWGAVSLMFFHLIAGKQGGKFAHKRIPFYFSDYRGCRYRAGFTFSLGEKMDGDLMIACVEQFEGHGVSKHCAWSVGALGTGMQQGFFHGYQGSLPYIVLIDNAVVGKAKTVPAVRGDPGIRG
ncbi:MAG: hypothetical protein U1E01_11840 [Methylicorpusculum sp.]|nr:hypothetical protein [Methylicorpusculum sp.]MDZ4151764.1 hypothetical protein [Methylicorpusculum sp.]